MGVGTSCGQEAVFRRQGEQEGVEGIFLLPPGEPSRRTEPVGIVDLQAVKSQRLQSPDQCFGRREGESRMSQDGDSSGVMERTDGFPHRDLCQGSPPSGKMNGFTDKLFPGEGLSPEKKSGRSLWKHLAGPLLPPYPLTPEERFQPPVMRVEAVPQKMDRFSVELSGDLHAGNDKRAADVEVDVS